MGGRSSSSGIVTSRAVAEGAATNFANAERELSRRAMEDYQSNLDFLVYQMDNGGNYFDFYEYTGALIRNIQSDMELTQADKNVLQARIKLARERYRRLS